MEYIIINENLTTIADTAFYQIAHAFNIFYLGTDEDFANIQVNSPTNKNKAFTSAIKYFYSEKQPNKSGNYWHYVNGVPTKW